MKGIILAGGFTWLDTGTHTLMTELVTTLRYAIDSTKLKNELGW
jgi:hypothetical protein